MRTLKQRHFFGTKIMALHYSFLPPTTRLSSCFNKRQYVLMALGALLTCALCTETTVSSSVDVISCVTILRMTKKKKKKSRKTDDEMVVTFVRSRIHGKG